MNDKYNNPEEQVNSNSELRKICGQTCGCLSNEDCAFCLPKAEPVERTAEDVLKENLFNIQINIIKGKNLYPQILRGMEEYASLKVKEALKNANG